MFVCACNHSCVRVFVRAVLCLAFKRRDLAPCGSVLRGEPMVEWGRVAGGRRELVLCGSASDESEA